MQKKNTSSCIITTNKCEPEKTVDIPISLFESMKRRYFVGQTECLWVGNKLNGWAGLINSHHSHINLYTNVFTISNFSDEYLTAEIWLNTKFPQRGKRTCDISPTNTSIEPLPENEAYIRYIESTHCLPEKGVNVYQRIIPPHTTVVVEEDGKFISGPGGNYVLVIKSDCPKLSKVVVAFGWWEEPKC